MFLNSKFAPLFVLIALSFTSTVGFSETANQEERVAAAFVLALGRTPTSDEVGKWTQSGEQSVAELISSLGAQLEGSASQRADVFAKAFQDAYGRAPSKSEAKAGKAETANYTAQMKAHVEVLSKDSEAYEATIRRAYQFVISRDAYDEEIAYWNERGTLSYALLVGCVEDWARRNQPGLMVTAGTPTVSVNSVFLQTVRLSPKTAAEARAAAGFGPAKESGKHLLAAGAEDIVAGGRVHFVVAGG